MVLEMIAVVIVNYRSEERTVKFVREEVSKISSPHAVVVVDNGSTPDSFKALSEGLPEGCALIPSEENAGFARACNLGASYAIENVFPENLEDSHILFSNNDIVFQDADVADVLSERLSSLPDVGVIGPKVVGPDGRLQSPEEFKSFWDKHIWVYWSTPFMSSARHAERFGYDHPEKAGDGPCYRVMGSFFLVRASDWKACGGMDPETFLYGEEAILSERMKGIGRKVWYCPGVSVLHEHGATTGKYYDRLKIREMKFSSDCYYYRKYIGTPGWQIALARFTYFLKKVFGR
ncbi:MAG: glycosyltransferase family 2 protein [Bacteroidales bacterium]|nr:glycosyltransferase family 2 protein [Bacteroidales bacterium]